MKSLNIDFALLLVVVTGVMGLVWLLDILWLQRRREAHANAKAGVQADVKVREPGWIEISKSFFPVLLFVLVLRSFLFEPFRIPSGSMLPTLNIGDFILVNKFSYGLRLPVSNDKIWDLGEPDRGDVAVFKYPKDPKVDYIKRIVGVPGDTLMLQDNVLYVLY